MKKEITYKGSKLTYDIIGKGPVVVLLHGFGEDSYIWKNQLDPLKEFTLLVPDLPGSGSSGMIDDMSMEGMADAIHYIIDEEFTTGGLNGKSDPSKNQVTMIGHSMGGYITLAFAEKYPNLLNGFGLFHSTAYADNQEKIETRKKGIDFIKRNGAYEFLKTAIPNLFSAFTRENYPHWINQQIEASHNFSGEALVSYYESMIRRPNRVEILKNSKVPVLFILGKHDVAVPLKDGLEQCYLPSLSYIEVLEKSGHMGMIEETETTNNILLKFLHHPTR